MIFVCDDFILTELFCYLDIFLIIDEAKAIEFDNSFEKKEKLSNLPSQERFRELVGMREPRK